MNDYSFEFGGTRLVARPAGTLYWPAMRLLCVADLHLGKAERMARRGGTMLPPYEAEDTLDRLAAEIDATEPAHVVALGDSFDDTRAAAALPEAVRDRIATLAAARDWTWITGNHDPSTCGQPGDSAAERTCPPLTFRHIAVPGTMGEVSGHYHPKARLALGGGSVARRCFLIDRTRIVLPAFGTYTGGLETTAPELCALMEADAVAVLTGRRALPVPMPRGGGVRRSA